MASNPQRKTRAKNHAELGISKASQRVIPRIHPENGAEVVCRPLKRNDFCAGRYALFASPSLHG
jgi:hypothetical protein